LSPSSLVSCFGLVVRAGAVSRESLARAEGRVTQALASGARTWGRGECLGLGTVSGAVKAL
jgi:hypothetical protein